MTGQCVAVVNVKGRGSHRCPFAGKHSHVAGGVTLHLCGAHYRMITRREKLGSTAPELAQRWSKSA